MGELSYMGSERANRPPNGAPAEVPATAPESGDTASRGRPDSPLCDLDGKAVLLTGASRGIGKALAVALGGLGARVACAARATEQNRLRLPGTVEETAAAVSAAGGEGLAVPCDLTRDGDAKDAVEAAAEHFGGLDVLVNNAAVSFPGDIDIDLRRYDLLMRINLRAPLLLTRLSREHLERSKGGGRILNMGSPTSEGYYPTMLTYGMSKLALEHLTVSSAAVLAPEIAVNCYRIDTQVASEGYVMNTPGEDHSAWADCASAAAGALRVLQQPTTFTGRIVNMLDLARQVPAIAALGHARFEPPGCWTLAKAEREAIA